jgi:MoaA/NifB/PqqE/SkfB family radical SAM enzyme
MHATLPLLSASDFPTLRRNQITALQGNLGYHCNQNCVHCHINADPKRIEKIDAETLKLIPEGLVARKLDTLGCASAWGN